MIYCNMHKYHTVKIRKTNRIVISLTNSSQFHTRQLLIVLIAHQNKQNSRVQIKKNHHLTYCHKYYFIKVPDSTPVVGSPRSTSTWPKLLA